MFVILYKKQDTLANQNKLILFRVFAEVRVDQTIFPLFAGLFFYVVDT
jgi:hypothetical protein